MWFNLVPSQGLGIAGLCQRRAVIRKPANQIAQFNPSLLRKCSWVIPIAASIARASSLSSAGGGLWYALTEGTLPRNRTCHALRGRPRGPLPVRGGMAPFRRDEAALTALLRSFFPRFKLPSNTAAGNLYGRNSQTARQSWTAKPSSGSISAVRTQTTPRTVVGSE